MTLKLVLKRGALVAAANWPVVIIQFAAETTFQVLLAVPIVVAAILVAVLLGADLAELLQGSVRDILAGIASALMSEPVALFAFVCAFTIVLVGGSALMFLIKGGTVTVLLDAEARAGALEREPITLERLNGASRFSVDRFIEGCTRLFRPYLVLGLGLVLVYALVGAVYLAVVGFGYHFAGGPALVVGWTVVAALAAVLLVAGITILNFLYLLLQILIAATGCSIRDGCRRVVRFIRAERRLLGGVFLVVLGLVVVGTLASALAWSAVSLISWVPVVGLAVFPVQVAAFLFRGLVFEYIGLTALASYATLYRRTGTTMGAVSRAAADSAAGPARQSTARSIA